MPFKAPFAEAVAVLVDIATFDVEVVRFVESVSGSTFFDVLWTVLRMRVFMAAMSTQGTRIRRIQCTQNSYLHQNQLSQIFLKIFNFLYQNLEIPTLN